MAGGWFSHGTLVSSTNKTDLHNITGILLKVVLSAIKPNCEALCLSETSFCRLYKASIFVSQIFHNKLPSSCYCIIMFQVGPPFTCGSLFDGTREGYVDLGMWSPGPVYTMAAWVRPDKADGVRRVSNFQGLLCPSCRTRALITAMVPHL